MSKLHSWWKGKIEGVCIGFIKNNFKMSPYICLNHPVIVHPSLAACYDYIFIYLLDSSARIVSKSSQGGNHSLYSPGRHRVAVVVRVTERSYTQFSRLLSSYTWPWWWLTCFCLLDCSPLLPSEFGHYPSWHLLLLCHCYIDSCVLDHSNYKYTSHNNNSDV